MADRLSALANHIEAGRFGADGNVGVRLQEIPNLELLQVAAWPNTRKVVTKLLHAVVPGDTGPGQVAGDSERCIIRVEPLKWWLIGVSVATLKPEQGVTLDLSHSRTRVRISGEHAAELLNRLIPIDLRAEHFPIARAASTTLHHVGITLWRHNEGYDLLMPRGFAVSLWDVMLHTALQFGVEVD